MWQVHVEYERHTHSLRQLDSTLPCVPLCVLRTVLSVSFILSLSLSLSLCFLTLSLSPSLSLSLSLSFSFSTCASAKGSRNICSKCWQALSLLGVYIQRIQISRLLCCLEANQTCWIVAGMILINLPLFSLSDTFSLSSSSGLSANYALT